MRLEGGCHVVQATSAQYAIHAVNTRGHVIAYDVLHMPRGPLTLPNGHVDPTAHISARDRTFRLQAILRVSHFPPPKATSRAYRYISDVSRVFWDCGSGSGDGTLGRPGFWALPASAPCFGSVFKTRCQSVLKRRKIDDTPYHGELRTTRRLRSSVVAQP
jgi:hypothetical protein